MEEKELSEKQSDTGILFMNAGKINWKNLKLAE